MSSYSCFIQVNNRDEILTLLNFCVIIAQNKYCFAITVIIFLSLNFVKSLDFL